MSPTQSTPTIPRNLPAALRKRSMTQWQLSQATGIHPSEVSRLCRGLKPSPSQADKIAAALNV